MDLICWPKLGTRSRRALLKQTKQYGWLYTYQPRPQLLDRLSRELGWTPDQVYQQLRKERRFLTGTPL